MSTLAGPARGIRLAIPGRMMTTEKTKKLVAMVMLAWNTAACGGAADAFEAGDADGPAVAAASAEPTVQESPTYKSETWPEANALFRKDPHWVGGDGAFSVDLGQGRVLWMFGDSFVDESGRGARDGAKIVNNTIAIQYGYNPAEASIDFYWGLDEDGTSAAYFSPVEEGTFLWPLAGIRTGETLTIFTSIIEHHSGDNAQEDQLNFSTVGYAAFQIDNPDATPAEWNVERLEVPETTFDMIGGVSLVQSEGFVYGFSTDKVDGFKTAYVMRWDEADFAAGNLAQPEHFDGSGWSAQASTDGALMTAASSEYSVIPDGQGGWLQIQSYGFGKTDITVRHAGSLTGTWSDPQTVFHPAESDMDDTGKVYAGKAHPHLEGADIVTTYVANPPWEVLAQDTDRYFPQFVKLTRN